MDKVQRTRILGGALCGLLAVAILFAGEILSASPPLTILGGFLCSLIFFLLILIIGTFRTIQWLEVIISELVAIILAAAVHRVSVTTTVIFSGALLYYTNYMSNKSDERKKKR